MRQIILDTETTGLDVSKDHRVVEIGCVEIIERRKTGRTFHSYLNPERATDAGALAVTGLSDEFLADKPKFRDVANEFLAFVDGAELIIHNAAFDIGFLNGELARLNRGETPLDQRCSVLDTLAMAREKYPGQKNSLDALCKRLNVESAHRTLHGALLDANLLLDVYLAMTAGQGEILFAGNESESNQSAALDLGQVAPMQLRLRRADAAETHAHQGRLAAIDKASKGKCVWIALERQSG
ncbi:DNA polymerase III subunit epsilon [Ahniella affigens]|uniref:DNA polymerase III subunit epsilon n=1 Tax=Ahniella affigens TaxID=2021234 RepID=A0A2P1PNB8_9GAMM|nr:DNA polymerase III subunit epsilon [Ahniella affigens]AVP96327.1 DNA polymerase III subunit epsilon [Ahniella affigens]